MNPASSATDEVSSATRTPAASNDAPTHCSSGRARRSRPDACKADISKSVTGETRMASRASALDNNRRERGPTRRVSPSALQIQTCVSSSSTRYSSMS